MKPFFDSTLPRGGDHTLSGPVAIVLGIGIFVSVAIAQVIKTNETRREAADFQLAAEQTIKVIEDRVDNQIELIRSIVSLFNSSDKVERSEFQSFVADSPNGTRRFKSWVGYPASRQNRARTSKPQPNAKA